MGKLIPLSSKKMKEMGIVNTRKGLYFSTEVQVPSPKKEVKNENKKHSKEIRKEIVKEKVEPKIQKVSIVERSNKKVEAQRLADRGIY